MSSEMDVMRRSHLTLLDGQFSQNNVGKRIKEIRIYSPHDVEIVDGDSKTVRIQQEFFHFPSFSKPEQFDAYLSAVYWNVVHLENGQYRILNHVRGKGGGSEISSEVSIGLNDQEKARLELLLKKIGAKTKEDVPLCLKLALNTSIGWALATCYDQGGRKRKTRPTYQNWLGESIFPFRALEDAKIDILILLKAGANPYECLGKAYTYHLSEERRSEWGWSTDFEPRDSSYRSALEEEFRIWLIQAAEEAGATMSESILNEYRTAKNARTDLIRRWVENAEPELLSEPLLIAFFRYSKEKDRSIEENMVRLILRSNLKDFSFELFFFGDERRGTCPELALSMLSYGYVYKDMNRVADGALKSCIEPFSGDISLFKALVGYGGKPAQESINLGFEEHNSIPICLWDFGFRPTDDLDKKLERRAYSPFHVKLFLNLGAKPTPLKVGSFCQAAVQSSSTNDCIEIIRRIAPNPIDPNAEFPFTSGGQMTPLAFSVKKDALALVEVLTEVGARKTTEMLLDAIDKPNASRYFQLLMQAEGEIDLRAVKAKLSDSLAKLCQQNEWTEATLQRLAFLLQYGADYTKIASRAYRFLPNAIRLILNNAFKEKENFVVLVRTIREKCILHLQNDQYQKLEQKKALAAFEGLVDRMLQDSSIIIGLHQEEDDEVVVLQGEVSKFLAEKLDNILGKTSLSFTENQLNEENIKKFIAPECVAWLSKDRRNIGIDLEKEKKTEEKKQFFISQFESQNRILRDQKEVMCEQLRTSGRAEKMSQKQIDELAAVNIKVKELIEVGQGMQSTLGKIEHNQHYTYY